MTEYKLDKQEEKLMHDIKLKLMNNHPEQIEARERGEELSELLTRALITFGILLISSSLIVSSFAM